MRTRHCLSLADARLLIEGARAEAERQELGVSIAVVDDAGVLVALERLDAARLHTPEVAWRKARTAAIARTETGTLQAQVKEHPAYATFPDRVPIEGGLPIEHEGEVVGAIGVSGGRTEEDVAVGRAGVARWSAAGAPESHQLS